MPPDALVYGRNGSLTLYLSHSEPPGAAAQANWLPAPSGAFHVILRLYQPTAAALDETWTPPPIFRAGEVLAPQLTRLRVTGTRLSYRDSQAAVTVVTVTGAGSRRLVVRLRHRDRVGLNRIALGRLHLAAGRYRLSARATGAAAAYDNAPSRRVTGRLRIR